MEGNLDVMEARNEPAERRDESEEVDEETVEVLNGPAEVTKERNDVTNDPGEAINDLTGVASDPTAVANEPTEFTHYRLPPIATRRHDINLDVQEVMRDPKNRLSESVVRRILKIGVDGRDNVDKYLVSDDPEIRKFCRRIKMKRRLKQGMALTDKETNLHEPTATENQMVASASKIRELIADSLQSITNVRAAAIKNEEERQTIERMRREEIDTLIKEEATNAFEKFEEISSKWEVISRLKDPLEIHEETEKQRDDCVALLEQKDVIIDNLKSRLKQADQEFYDELARQNDYINILSDRINEQISLMGECYREELQNMQRVINEEKDEVLEERVEQWSELAEMKETLEQDNIAKRYNYLKQHEELIDSMLIDQHELMRSQMMRMEARLNRLTLEENRFRSAVMINTELLNYNVQILQKRQEENRVIKAHQKRVVNKLQESARRLSKQQSEEFLRLHVEKKQLADEMRKTVSNIKIAKERLKILATAGDRRYFQLWDYNQEVAEKQIHKIMRLDKKIHKELLGVPWRAQKIEFRRSNMPSYNRAVEEVDGADGVPHKRRLWTTLKEGDIRKLSTLVVDGIQKRFDYLMDDNLKTFLHPFPQQCQSLITLHHIFETLGVHDKDDINYMLKYFRPFVECKQCKELPQDQGELSKITGEISKKGQDSIEAVSKRLSQQLTQMNQIRDSFMIDEENLEMMSGEVAFDSMDDVDITPWSAWEEPSEQRVDRQVVPSLCKEPGHHLIIKFHHVAAALREFVIKLNEEKRWDEFLLSDDLPSKKFNVSHLLRMDEVERFWEAMPKFFPPQKKLLWKSTSSQIKDYYKLILRRNHLKHETKKLQRQSFELRRLLTRYLQPSYPRENLKVGNFLQ